MGPLGERRGWSLAALLGVASILGPMLLGSAARTAGASAAAPLSLAPGESSCEACHAGIEEMHPEAELSCVDCHGGDDTQARKSRAHVKAPTASSSDDERVWDQDKSLRWRRFLNPMDLRVVDKTCGDCHGNMVESVRTSLHGTTAGHLSDGYYEMGILKQRGSKFGIFGVDKAKLPGGEVERLFPIPGFMDQLPEGSLAAHFSDLARKECMQCHLWSQGRAVRGRVGFDGDYRGEGCAACHVDYALDGLSESGDQQRRRGEPGHPRQHRMMRAPTTRTCTTCHYGDATIGLNFRGLSQLPPDAPGGPDIEGTTDVQLNRSFYLNDPSICPPDIHYERGMDCVDCHTAKDLMGDGQLHGQMEHAVEISCQACHGSFDEVSSLVTERGNPLTHLRREGDQVLMVGKASGKEFVVPQVVHVVDPKRPEYNKDAAQAMVAEHASMECYSCHSSWNPNFLGFHFSRNASLTQLDLISGRRTPGRVTTQEKVFATWKSFYLGLNEKGAVAPYLTGFSTMGSYWDEEGVLQLDQVMPETKAGLSGMSMVHHQMHTVRDTSRSCVECHRTSATWGMGSSNFRLARQLAFVADRRGIEVVGMDRGDLAASIPLTKLPLSNVVDLEVQSDPLQGHAEYLYAAEGGRGVHVIDVRNPLRPRRVAFVASIGPRNLELSGKHLYVADGAGGLKVYSVEQPDAPELVGHLPSFDAHDVDVKWPWAYLADGPGGLTILDIRAPIAPLVVGSIDLNSTAEPSAQNEAIAVESLFQYSRPLVSNGKLLPVRTHARNLCAVLDRKRGLFLVDVTQADSPELLFPLFPRSGSSSSRLTTSFRGLALRSQVDPAQTQGGSRTQERDYVYVLRETSNGPQSRSNALIYDVSNPRDPALYREEPASVRVGFSTEQLISGDYYNPPFRRRMLLTPGDRGVSISDASDSHEPQRMGFLRGLGPSYALAMEEFPLDRMIGELGEPEKDISREESRWLFRTEIERILGVSEERLRFDGRYKLSKKTFGETLRLHLARLDQDRSGFLEGEEYEAGGGLTVDLNGDQRISLFELARQAKALHTAPEGSSSEPRPLSTDAELPLMAGRTFVDGDLACLLDGINPFAFDRNKDLRLKRSEADQAVLHALDLDGDGSLSMAEASRYPGELRTLRYGDELSAQLFRRYDKNNDKRLRGREFRLADAEWEALDADQDGFISLVPGQFDFETSRGLVAGGSEWPARRYDVLPLPPSMGKERLLSAFDADGDGLLARSEMRARPELFERLDRDQSSLLEDDELERMQVVLSQRRVDACPDDFEGRWDLDGSGAVEQAELPRIIYLRVKDHL